MVKRFLVEKAKDAVLVSLEMMHWTMKRKLWIIEHWLMLGD